MVARVEVKYESDEGSIHLMKLTPDYAAAGGTQPTAEANSDIIPKVSKSNREFGIRPRGVRLGRTIGTAPDTFRKYTFLAVFTETEYNSTAFNRGATVTIGTTAWTVIARSPEDY